MGTLSFLLLDIILFCNNNDAIVRAFIYTKQRVFVFGRGEGRAWERGYRDSQTSGLEHCWRQRQPDEEVAHAFHVNILLYVQHTIFYMTPVPGSAIKMSLATVTQSTPSPAHLSHNPLLHTLSAHRHTSSPYRLPVIVTI